MAGDSGVAADLVKKVEALEQEKVELVKENEEVKEKVRKWEKEVLGLRVEQKEMEELVKKAEEGDLESEVLRLRHEVSVAMSEGDEANAEVREELEESKLRVGELEREKESMKEGFLVEIEEVNKAKAVVEAKVGELESKIKGIEARAKAGLAVKATEISFLKKKVAEWEAAISKGGLDLSKEQAEKKALENALSVSEAKVGELETKLIQLLKKVEEAERVISGLKETLLELLTVWWIGMLSWSMEDQVSEL